LQLNNYSLFLLLEIFIEPKKTVKRPFDFLRFFLRYIKSGLLVSQFFYKKSDPFVFLFFSCVFSSYRFFKLLFLCLKRLI